MVRNFTPQESAIFESEYDRLLSVLTLERDIYPFSFNKAWVRDSLLKFLDAESLCFGGCRPSADQLGWRLIRPEDVNPANLPQADPLLRTNWEQGIPQQQANGWTDYRTAAQQQQQGGIQLRVSERKVMVVMGYIDLSLTPLITAAQFTMSQQPQTVDYFEYQSRISNLPIYRMQVPLEIKDTTEYDVEIDIQGIDQQNPPTQGDIELALAGLIFERGSEMLKQTPEVIV